MNEKNLKIIITGTGFRLYDKDISDITNIFKDQSVKPNIGSSCANLLANKGYDIIMISRTPEKLRIISNSIKNNINKDITIEWEAMDLLNPNKVKKFVDGLSVDKNYSFIHSAGLSAGSYEVDNPYLHLEDTPEDLPTMEYESVVKSLLLMMKNLLPKLKSQEESRVVVISSMSGIRSVPLGFSHTSAKAGLHQAVRSMVLELNKQNIQVSEVLPGIVDTGYYDSENVKNSVREMGKLFGYEYDELPMMPPESVAETAALCLESDSHILSINMVAQGQFPNLGA